MSTVPPYYLKNLVNTGITQYIPELVTERIITISNAGYVLESDTFTLEFTDTDAIEGITKYSVWYGTQDLSSTVTAPSTSIIVTGLPTDGRNLTLTLKPPAGYTADEFVPVNASFTAFNSVSIGNDIILLNALKVMFDRDNDEVDSWYSQSSTQATGAAVDVPLRLTAEGGYYKWYSSSALARMYKNTGDISYLDRAIQHSQEYIAAGTQLDGNDAYLDWWCGSPGTTRPPGGIEYNQEHMEWRAAAGIANVAIEMLNGGLTVEDTRIIEFEDYLENHVWNKWTPVTTATSLLERLNVNTQNSWYVARLGQVAIALDKIKKAKGITSNKWATYLNSTDTTSNRIYDFINTIKGTYAVATDSHMHEGWTNGAQLPRSTYPIDMARSVDVYWFFRLLAEERYHSTLVTKQFMDRLANQINAVVRKSTGWTNNVDGSGGIAASSGASGYEWQGISILSGNNTELRNELASQWINKVHPSAISGTVGMSYESKMMITSGLYAAINEGSVGSTLQLEFPATTSNKTDRSIKISFTATEFVKAYTEIRTVGGAWEIKANEISFNYKSHVQTIGGLSGDTSYEYRITIENPAGDVFTTLPASFKTLVTVEYADNSIPFNGKFGGAPQINSYGPGNTEGGVRLAFRVHLEASTYTGYANSIRYLRDQDVTGRAPSNSKYQDIIDAGMNDTPINRNKGAFHIQDGGLSMGMYVVGNGGAYEVEIRPVGTDGYPDMTGDPLATTAPDTFIPLDHDHGLWPELTFVEPVTLEEGWYCIVLINQMPARYEDLPANLQNGRTGYVYSGLTMTECAAMPNDRGHMSINGFDLDKSAAGNSLDALQGPFLSSTNVFWDKTGSNWEGYNAANKGYWLLKRADGNYVGQNNHVEFGRAFNTSYSTGFDMINVQGATMLKQDFTQRVTRQIRTIRIPLGWKYNSSSTQGLTIRLRNSSGTVIATTTIGYSAALRNLVVTSSNPMNWDGFNAKEWLTGAFDNNVTLIEGQKYSLDFSAPSGAGWFITGCEMATDLPNLWAEHGLGGFALKSTNWGASYGEFSNAGAYRKGPRFISHLLTWVGYPDGTTPF